jgi:hypothetical protein
MHQRSSLKLDKSTIEIADSFEEAAAKDRTYWLLKTPIERFVA